MENSYRESPTAGLLFTPAYVDTYCAVTSHLHDLASCNFYYSAIDDSSIVLGS
jgi:hypothetical protein